MEKKDFDILLSPIKTANQKKDISFLIGVSSVGQKIQNLLYTVKGNRAFMSTFGTNLQISLSTYNSGKRAILLSSLKSSIENKIKTLKNVNISMKNSYVASNYVDVKVVFDYMSQDGLKKNNQVTVSINMNT